MLNRIFTILGTVALVGAHSILDFGALPSALEIDTPTSVQNSQAFLSAIQAANSSETDRLVHIPKLADGQKIYMMGMLIENIHNIRFQIDGDVVASEDNVMWPNHTDWQLAKHVNYSHYLTPKGKVGGSDYGPVISFWEIHDSSNLEFYGSGTVDGQGYAWWMREYFVLNYANRPHLLRMDRVRDVKIQGIRWVNSPMYHLFLIDIENFDIRDTEIYVDVYSQKKLAQTLGHYDYKLDIPTFPLNTDGIDPSGRNIYMKNLTITNFDDAVAVKPANRGY